MPANGGGGVALLPFASAAAPSFPTSRSSPPSSRQRVISPCRSPSSSIPSPARLARRPLLRRATSPLPTTPRPSSPTPSVGLLLSSTRNARRTSSPPAQRPAPVSSSPCRCALPLHWCPQPRRTPLPRPTHLYARCVSFSSVQAAGVSRLSRPCNASLSFNLLPLPVSFPLPGWNCPAALPLLRRDDSYLRLLLQFHRLQYSRCDCGGC
jgi:hypothetical protein